jgi:HPt (histidine-containing phosphotransfer) domain-containing protein
MLAGDILAKNLDWPGASEIAERLEQKYKEAKGQLPPEVENMIKQGKETIAKLQKENEMLKAEHNLKREANMIDKHEAETKRMKVENDFLIDQLPAIPTPGENNG